jgi:AraC-like DNA-binding protein
MPDFVEWRRFLKTQSASAPLIFDCGVWHSVEAGFYCEPHSHEGLELVFHPSGIGTTCINAHRSITFEEGSVVIYAPGQVHDQRVCRKGEDFCVQILSRPPCPPLPRSCLYVPPFNDPGLADDIRKLAQRSVSLLPSEQAVFNHRATAVLLAVVNYACDFIEQSSVPLAERYVLEAEDYIRLHLQEIEFMADIADSVGIGYDHLRHLFRERRGRSLISYVNELRLERSKVLLIRSRLPLKQIAALCGFCDEYYFSSVFRKHFKMPPARYRARYWQSQPADGLQQDS